MKDQRDITLQRIESLIGYVFNDLTLLKLALTHRSCGTKSNERLEFLGDSILNFIIAEALYKKFPDIQEGHLSRLRANLVCGTMLATIAKELHLHCSMYLGSGESKNGGQQRDSVLADAVEATIGAIYLDSDFYHCQKCVLAWFYSRLKLLSLNDAFNKDPKTRLQEWLQHHKKPLPIYKLIDTRGKFHEQEFIVQCHITGFVVTGQGQGKSLKKAEQQAAQEFLSNAGIKDTVQQYEKKH